MGALTAERGWVALLGAVLAYEIACDEGEMLSHGMDRLMERHPVWPRIAAVLVALHVANLIPHKYDAVSLAFTVFRRVGGAVASGSWIRRLLRGI